MNVSLSSLRTRAHLSWRTGKHLHVLHVLPTYSTCSYPGNQDTTIYAALSESDLDSIRHSCNVYNVCFQPSPVRRSLLHMSRALSRFVLSLQAQLHFGLRTHLDFVSELSKILFYIFALVQRHL